VRSGIERSNHPGVASRPAGIFDRRLNRLLRLQIGGVDHFDCAVVSARRSVVVTSRRRRGWLLLGRRLSRAYPAVRILIGSRRLSLSYLLRNRRKPDGERGSRPNQ